MAFHVRDEATDLAVRKLAKLKGKSLTATIREAVENDYQRERQKIPLSERLEELRKWVDARSKPDGLPADKAFFDELSGEF
jgi:antitoxin VapB